MEDKRMKKIPTIINYVKSGTEFYMVTSGLNVVKFNVVKAMFKESVDMDLNPKLHYIVERADGKRFEVSEPFLRTVFPTLELAEQNAKEGRYETTFSNCLKPNKSITTKNVLINENGLREEQIKKTDDGWLTVWGWFESEETPIFREINFEVELDNELHFTNEAGMFDSAEECVWYGSGKKLYTKIMNYAVTAINASIDNGAFENGVTESNLLECCDDFTRYAIGAMEAFGGQKFTDAEMCFSVSLVHNTVKKALMHKGIEVLD